MKYSWVLHSTDKPTELSKLFKDWTDLALSFNSTLELEPHVIGISGEKYSGNVMRFKTGYKKAAGAAYEGIDGISLYTVNPNYDFAYYWQILFSISLVNDDFSLFIGTDVNVTTKDHVIQEAIIPICNLLNISYGYSYTMPFEKGPFAYGSSGIDLPPGFELSDEEEMYLIKSSPYNRILNAGTAIFRDIYQENILTELQMNAPVEGMLLRNWIMSDPAHGTLTELAGKAFWKLEKEKIVYVRNILNQHGLLVAFDKNIVPGLVDFG